MKTVSLFVNKKLFVATGGFLFIMLIFRLSQQHQTQFNKTTIKIPDSFIGCKSHFVEPEMIRLHRLLPPDDAEQLLDLEGFAYTMQQPACSTSTLALILIHTAPAHSKKRLVIRETWGQRALFQGTPVRLLFLLGAVANRTMQHRLQLENEIFADMVQGNFVDDYKNMTYKHTMAFKWFIYNCAQAQVLIKLDDDVFVNTYQLLRYSQGGSQRVHPALNMIQLSRSSFSAWWHRLLNVDETLPDNSVSPAQHLFRHPQCLLYCQLNTHARVKRSYRSKWRVSVHEYHGRYFPPYCAGYSIIYSRDVLMRLYLALQSEKYFWIDDVFVTGIHAHLLSIPISSSLPYVLTRVVCERVLAGTVHLSDLEFLFAWPKISEQQIRALWQLNQLHHDLTLV